MSPRSHRVSHGASVERPYCLEGRVSPLTPPLAGRGEQALHGQSAEPPARGQVDEHVTDVVRQTQLFDDQFGGIEREISTPGWLRMAKKINKADILLLLLYTLFRC